MSHRATPNPSLEKRTRTPSEIGVGLPAWQQHQYIALDRRVLLVAVRGSVGDWAAYIGAVPGENHAREVELIERRGTKVPREVAEFFFPTWRKLNWRD